MLRERPGGHRLPTAVAEVEKSRDAHDREPAAWLLDRRLGEALLVFLCVGELDGGAVNGLEGEAMPEIDLLLSPYKGLVDALRDLGEESIGQPAPGFAVGTGVTGRDRQALGAIPALDEADGF